LPDAVVVEIERMRRQRMTGPAIASALGLARSTVGLVLRRLGLGRLAKLEQKRPDNRYERSLPGEMIHLPLQALRRRLDRRRRKACAHEALHTAHQRQGRTTRLARLDLGQKRDPIPDHRAVYTAIVERDWSGAHRAMSELVANALADAGIRSEIFFTE
jgi:hypothetical protein